MKKKKQVKEVRAMHTLLTSFRASGLRQELKREFDGYRVEYGKLNDLPREVVNEEVGGLILEVRVLACGTGNNSCFGKQFALRRKETNGPWQWEEVEAG